MKWFVSRQCYWGVDPDEQEVVEIASGGIDYANPDMLVAKYAGEGEEYSDPREAVNAAIVIAEQWKLDKPDYVISIARGCTGGYTMPFESDDVENLKKWAIETYEKLPKCDRCGEILQEGSTCRLTDDPDYGEFCSENCANMAAEELYREEA
jgi:hypothetical protein